MYEVLCLLVLLIFGVVLLDEAGSATAHALHDDCLQLMVCGQAIAKSWMRNGRRCKDTRKFPPTSYLEDVRI